MVLGLIEYHRPLIPRGRMKSLGLDQSVVGLRPLSNGMSGRNDDVVRMARG
jgi:hypothetical protein